jgi:hypothetical protein
MALVVTLIAGQTALACDCPAIPESESFRRADIVFEGEVVRKTDALPNRTYTFRVNKLLKGSPVSEVIVGGTGTNCDEHFDVDVIYRVYARTVDGKLITHQCFGNKALQDVDWPSLSYLRHDYKAVSAVAYVNVFQAEITGRIGGYENWRLVADVFEPFKGRLKRGDRFEFFHGAEAGFKRDHFLGQKIVFLLAERDADGKPRYTVLENSTLPHTKDRVNKLRVIRRSSLSKRVSR